METADCAFATHGFAVVPDVFSWSQCAVIAAAVSRSLDSAVGLRAWLSEPWCRELAALLRRHPSLSQIVSAESVAVQCTLFEKSPDRNWLVSLHQDLSIPVEDHVPDGRLSGWSVKEGRTFVQPPVSILESLIAIRVHLDDCGPETGALRVVPGSHRFGRLDAAQSAVVRGQRGEIAPVEKRGAVFAMRPLLLHAASKATVPSLRRVLHFVFGPPSLPSGLRWADAV